MRDVEIVSVKKRRRSMMKRYEWTWNVVLRIDRAECNYVAWGRDELEAYTNIRKDLEKKEQQDVVHLWQEEKDTEV